MREWVHDPNFAATEARLYAYPELRALLASGPPGGHLGLIIPPAEGNSERLSVTSPQEAWFTRHAEALREVCAITQAVRQLSPLERRFVICWYWERIRPNKVAAMLGISPRRIQSVRGRVVRTVAALLSAHDAT